MTLLAAVELVGTVDVRQDRGECQGECYVRGVLMLARWLDGVCVIVVLLFACRLTCPTSLVRLLSMVGNFLAL